MRSRHARRATKVSRLLLGPCARDQLRQSCDHRAAQYDARERVQMPMRRQVPECPTMRALKDTRVVRRDRPPAHVSGEIGAAECSAFRPLLGTGGSRTRSCPRPLQNSGSTRPRLQRFRGYTSSQWVAKTSWGGIGSLSGTPKSPKGVVDVGRLVSADRQKWRLDRLPNDGRQNWHEGHFFVGFFGSRSASSRSIAARMNAAIFSPGLSTASMRWRTSTLMRMFVEYTLSGGRPIRE